MYIYECVGDNTTFEYHMIERGMIAGATMTETIVLDADASLRHQPAIAAITHHSSVDDQLRRKPAAITPKQPLYTEAVSVEQRSAPRTSHSETTRTSTSVERPAVVPRTSYSETITNVSTSREERPSATVYHDVTPRSPVREKRPSTSEYEDAIEPKRR